MESKTFYRVLCALLALLAALALAFAAVALAEPTSPKAVYEPVPDILDEQYVKPVEAEAAAEPEPDPEPVEEDIWVEDDFGWYPEPDPEPYYGDYAYTEMFVEMYEDEFGPVPEEGYYGDGSGVLTKEGGVNYYNGRRETWYSQRVLPGGGLDIPGRHVAEDGTIRDEDGLICVAADDLPYGSLVETSLGLGKVYDCGCPAGTTDIYVDW